MKIVVALDSFKGSIDARTACNVVCGAIHSIRPEFEIIAKPLADGGEGTADVLLASCGGDWIESQVMGPLPHLLVESGFAKLARPEISVVEMAAASGLPLLRSDQRDPMKTTTYGTGELLKAAFEIGNPVWLALGGSATVDGGVGAAMALGWQFLDQRGNAIGHGGGALENIAKIIPPAHRNGPPIEVLCDVTNPLCGPQGAARIFGPQKGASPSAVEKLDRGLQHLAEMIRRDIGIDVLSLRGGGAAGGLAAGAVAFFGATMRSGIGTVIDAIDLRRDIADADWVITGEGSFDSQSLHGKVVSGVIDEVRKTRTKIAVIAGRVGLDEEACRAAGIARTLALMTKGMSEDFAMTQARELLEDRARELALMLS